MQRKTLCKDDIIAYVRPELETLKALFSSLKLKASAKAIDFVQTVLEFELNRASTPLLSSSHHEENDKWQV